MKKFLLVTSLILEIQAPSTPSNISIDNQTLIQSNNLVYQGSFRVPAGTFGGSSFDYGGSALAYNNNSLFIVGHPYQQFTAEISIPTPIKGLNLNNLNTATIIQPFTDALSGHLKDVYDNNGDNTTYIGGQLVYNNQLHINVFLYYDGTGLQSVSHFISSTNLRYISGPTKIGPLNAGFYSGYMTLNWQSFSPILIGQCCIPIISRTSYGPSLFSTDLVNISNTKPLVYYPQSHPLLQPGTSGDGYSTTSTYFNGATEIKGVVFPNNKRSILFFGKQGTGKFCYGTGTGNQSLDGMPVGDGSNYCYDPESFSKGTHAFPYFPYVWAYDVNDLLSVKNGNKNPWDVMPYAVWSLNLPFKGPSLAGAAYDLLNNRIFISQQFADGLLPVISVFTVQ